MPIELICTMLLALILGAVACFAGYRFFLKLLPIWGFIVGFSFGAGLIAGLFGTEFLATLIGWIAGFIAGIALASLAFFVYAAGIALVAVAFGFSLGTGVMYAFGMEPGVFAWLTGIVVAVAVVLFIFRLEVQKYVIIAITGIGGASAIIAGVLLMAGKIGIADLSGNAVRQVRQDSILWTLVWLILCAAGIAVQISSTRGFVWRPAGHLA